MTNSMLSRVADSLYWMSRYLERAENTARLLDVYRNFMLEVPEVTEHEWLFLLQNSLTIEAPQQGDPDTILRLLSLDMTNSASIIHSTMMARENARQVREQISSEMWTQINRLYLEVQSITANGNWRKSPHDFYRGVKDGSHLFQGITDATMNHNQGWHFIQLGRAIERTLNLLRLLSVHFHDISPARQYSDEPLDYMELIAVLKSVSAYEAYCKVYNPNLQIRWIIEFLLFNDEFPRSLRFGIDSINSSLKSLVELTGQGRHSKQHRLSGRLQSNLRYDEITDIWDLQDYLDNIKRQILQIHDMLFETYITYPIETAL